MQNSWSNIDFRAMAETLRESISNSAGFSPRQVRDAGILSEAALSNAILRALESGKKTGHDIIDDIAEASKSGLKPAAGTIYPLLESLIDEELISVKVTKDRKVYSLTDAGKSQIENMDAEPADVGDQSENTWPIPKWVDLKSEVGRAGARLAKVALDVSKNGTKEQQQQAAEIIDEARRRIHALLAAE